MSEVEPVCVEKWLIGILTYRMVYKGTSKLSHNKAHLIGNIILKSSHKTQIAMIIIIISMKIIRIADKMKINMRNNSNRKRYQSLIRMLK